MKKVRYTNVISNYTKEYDGIVVGPTGTVFDEDNETLEKYVPFQLEKEVINTARNSLLGSITTKSNNTKG